MTGLTTVDTPVVVGSLEFALILATPIIAGWVGLRGRNFSALLGILGIALAASWLTATQAVIFLLALAPAWVATQRAWGAPDTGAQRLILPLVGFQVLLLIVTKLGTPSEALGIAGVVGLSYLTFRQIHLLVIAPRMPEGSMPGFFDWLGYLINPWSLLAGPVQTWAAHKTALNEMARPDRDEMISALHRVANGAIKILVLAPIFAGQGDLAGLELPGASWRDGIVIFYAYYIFLFLDFSGYIDLVTGASRLAGFRGVPENFNRPYLATNFQDFWGRWNITLGLWFRAHVFMPMQAMLLRQWGLAYQNLVISISLFSIFVLIGLWHGLGWNYALFGIVHAVGVTGAHLSREWVRRRFGKAALSRYEAHRGLKVIRILICQHAIAASFIFLDNDADIVFAKIGELL